MSMKDRETSFENKYAHDQEMMFKIEARTAKLLGLWAAEQMSLQGEEADTYAKSLVEANLDEPGFDDIKRKVLQDFAAKGVDISEHILDVTITRKSEEAEQQILQS